MTHRQTFKHTADILHAADNVGIDDIDDDKVQLLHLLK